MDFFHPIWADPLNYHFQGFTHGHLSILVFVKMAIDRIKPRVARVIVVNEGWRVVEGLSPELNLFLSKYFGSFFFRVTLQSSIMSFIDPPWLSDMNGVFKAHLLQDDRACLVSSGEHGRVGDVEVESFFFEVLTCFHSLVSSCLVQRYVYPTAELTLFVPKRLTVSHKDYFEFCFAILVVFQDRVLLGSASSLSDKTGIVLHTNVLSVDLAQRLDGVILELTHMASI